MRRASLVIFVWLAADLVGCSAFSRAPDAASPDSARAGGTSATPDGPTVPDTMAVDRIVVRWYAPETGGVSKPQFVFARELSFEARIEALADPDPDSTAYRDRHVRAALDRHITETLLASLPILPDAPTASEIAQRAASARALLEQRVGGRDRLAEAATAEGISDAELTVMLQRQATASIYLEKMVAPMLDPTELELLALHRSGGTPFSSKPFDEVKEPMKRWYVNVRLVQALETYYQNARSRVSIVTIKKP